MERGVLRTIFVSLIFWCAANVHAGSSWAEETLKKMSLEEKIGQLFMIAAYVDPEYARLEIGNPDIIQEIDRYITQYHVGGLAWVGPSEWRRQVALTNHYQEISTYPLLIAQDLEWGLSMRIRDGMRFPKNITLGAIDDLSLIYAMGKEVGRQARLIGVHMNLSPVLDVNIEPENIAINVRSFGSSPLEVADRGVAMIQGLQAAGVIASAKHFPGIGDISVDPHLGLPRSPHGRKRLQEVELYPFIKAIDGGVLSIQTEHVMIPTLEPDPNTPSSLSHKVVTCLLQNEMGFTGLVLSGALRMKALTDHFPAEQIILQALLAGNEMLLMPEDFPGAYQTAKRAVETGAITEEDLNRRVLKILEFKERAHLHEQKIVPIPSTDELHSVSAKELKKLLFQKAVTLVRNGQHLVPLSLPRIDPVAYVQLGEALSSSFQDLLGGRLTLDPLIVPSGFDDPDKIQELVRHVKEHSLAIIAVYPADPRRIEKIRLLDADKRDGELKEFRVHGMSESLVRCINALRIYDNKTVIVFFGNPFGLHFLDPWSTVIMTYEAEADAEQAAAALVTGF